jgi:hypothetical protein
MLSSSSQALRKRIEFILIAEYHAGFLQTQEYRCFCSVHFPA